MNNLNRIQSLFALTGYGIPYVRTCTLESQTTSGPVQARKSDKLLPFNVRLVENVSWSRFSPYQYALNFQSYFNSFGKPRIIFSTFSHMTRNNFSNRFIQQYYVHRAVVQFPSTVSAPIILLSGGRQYSTTFSSIPEKHRIFQYYFFLNNINLHHRFQPSAPTIEVQSWFASSN